MAIQLKMPSTILSEQIKLTQKLFQNKIYQTVGCNSLKGEMMNERFSTNGQRQIETPINILNT